jgi:prepilin-type processing-associated H-X9-DG protein
MTAGHALPAFAIPIILQSVEMPANPADELPMHTSAIHQRSVGYSPFRGRRWWLGWPSLVGLLLGVGLFVSIASVTSTVEGRRRANMIKCAWNLNEIGKAISLYAADHRNQFPDSFQTLLKNGRISSAMLVCPASSDAAAAGGPGSYIYLGCGLTTKSGTAKTVVAYEPLSNHPKLGINVLFGDGHVATVSGEAASKIVGAVATGSCPATMP